MTNVVITGFMGTGKTVIGREVAHLLNREFIDLDQKIEQDACKPIHQIFEEEGEKHFRDLEKKVCFGIGDVDDVVISTGGGTFIDTANQDALSKNGVLIRLDSSIEKIMQRLSTNEEKTFTRPLLSATNTVEHITKLFAERRDIYERIPISINTDELSVHEAAKRIIEIYDRSKISVHYPGGSYNVHIKHDLIKHVGQTLRKFQVNHQRKIIIITNDLVADIYLEGVVKSLESSGYTSVECVIPDGEQNKNIHTINAVYDELVRNKVDRQAIVLALGGGVTGDLAGFIAATFMRGLDFINIPTSLLAMVDASVGGKTGYDHPEGKNIIGAFKQPLFVLVDPNLLTTLDDKEIKCGMAELIKTAIIGDADLFEELEQDQNLNPSWFKSDSGLLWISRSLNVKTNIIGEDPYEKNFRAWLNLGHTLGHGLEKMSGYKIRHGEAVSIGTFFASRLAFNMGILSQIALKRIENVLIKWGLPTACPPYPIKAILQSIAIDKKRKNSTQRWILPLDIGKVDIYENIDQKLITDILQSIGAVDE